jgi:two-component sensor histidine kinase
VVGLIEIEEALYDDPRTKGTLQRLQNRVESIAELYGLLSRSQDQSSIELSELVGKIAAHLAESFGAEQRGISLRVKLEELHIGSRPAMSLGIIVNEILTDCFKHAFPPGRAGSIVLTLCKTEPGARLEIMDDGIGLPSGFSLKNSPGFGMRLVGSLASDLGSSVEIGTGPGAHFILDIPTACLDVEKGLA